MNTVRGSAAERVRPLLRTRQIREFTDQPISREELDALADVARWSGSSSNKQPWRFIVVEKRDEVHRLGEAAPPQTRGLLTAAAAIAIVLPSGPADWAVTHAYDEGRATERILIGANMLGLAAGISWVLPDKVETFRKLFGVGPDWMIRTIVAIGHPTEAALRPKSQPGQARLPREQVVFEGRWPNG